MAMLPESSMGVPLIGNLSTLTRVGCKPERDLISRRALARFDASPAALRQRVAPQVRGERA